jgi:hypothetical protein
MSATGTDPMFEGWEKLDWKERRERCFQRWLGARGVDFASDQARADYLATVSRFPYLDENRNEAFDVESIARPAH